MELRRLRYFIAVADHLSFRRAGEALRTAQPSLSQQIRLLEEELGVELFERTKRQVRLTNAGTELLAGVRVVIGELDACAKRAREAQSGTRGRLSIGTNGMVMIEHLPRIVKAFRSLHPQADVQLTIFRAPELRQAVRQGRVGIAFTTDDSHDERLELAALWKVMQQIVLPSNHRLASAPAVALRDLQSETLVTHPDRGIGGSNTVMALYQELHYVPAAIRSVSEVAELDSLMGLVACGYGFTILPAPYAQLSPPSVVFKPFAEKIRPLQVVARWRTDDPNPLVRSFVAAAHAECARSANATTSDL